MHASVIFLLNNFSERVVCLEEIFRLASILRTIFRITRETSYHATRKNLITPPWRTQRITKRSPSKKNNLFISVSVCWQRHVSIFGLSDIPDQTTSVYDWVHTRECLVGVRFWWPEVTWSQSILWGGFESVFDSIYELKVCKSYQNIFLLKTIFTLHKKITRCQFKNGEELKRS